MASETATLARKKATGHEFRELVARAKQLALDIAEFLDWRDAKGLHVSTNKIVAEKRFVTTRSVLNTTYYNAVVRYYMLGGWVIEVVRPVARLERVGDTYTLEEIPAEEADQQVTATIYHGVECMNV